MEDSLDNQDKTQKPVHRNKRPPLKSPPMFGFGKANGEPIRIKYKSDQDPISHAADQGYDIRPLTEAELAVHTKRLLMEYHRLLREMEESRDKYEEAEMRGAKTKEFAFKKGDKGYRVAFGVGENNTPFLSIEDITAELEQEQALRQGVPERELLDPLDEKFDNSTILEINHENNPTPYLFCEGWQNDQEALRAANEWQQELREGI